MWKRIKSKVLDFVFPSPISCAYCQEKIVSTAVHLRICQNCLQKIKFFQQEWPGNGFGGKWMEFDLGSAAVVYDGPIKEMIYRLKYHGERKLINPLVELMYYQFPTSLALRRWDGLIPVPMHRSRLAKRGFNQSRLLAQILSFYLQIPCKDLVLRVKETQPQNKLSPKERIKNIQGAFTVKREVNMKGGRFLIIDDILTTGSTVNEMSRLIRQAGCQEIGVYALASGRTHE